VSYPVRTVLAVPRIAAFYGIVIFIYSREHGRPHFHARHGDHEAVVAIDDGEALAGGPASWPGEAGHPVVGAPSGGARRSVGEGEERRGTRYDRATAMTRNARTPAVVGVAVTRPHVMRLLFDDGVIRDVEFVPSGDHGPLVLPLNDPAYFARVVVDPEARTVVWPNGLDLAPEVLHGDEEPEDPLGFRDITPAELIA
jgi:hypothetical protein